MRKYWNIGLQYFAEAGDPPADPPNSPPASSAPPDYEHLYKTDEKFKNFVNRQSEQAVTDYRKKQETLNNEKLSEAEKLKTMNAEEIAEYYRLKYEKSEAARQRMEEAASLKAQTEKMLSDSGIPADFITDFDFETATAEGVKKRVDFLGGYEIYPKGTFDAKVNAALNEKLKQKAPESHGSASQGTDTELRRYFGV